MIIAAAGSGKTTYLVNNALNKKEQILILTYTISNENVIKKKIIELNSCMPTNVTVQTWFSFLLQHGVKPYQGSLNEELFNKDIKGLLLVNSDKNGQAKRRKKPSEEKEFIKHYFTKDFKIYSDKISKFVFKSNKESNNAIIDRLGCIYKCIYIDEVQDLAGYDLDLLKSLFKSPIEVILVGDPRQVTYLTHHERRHNKYKNGGIEEFIKNKIGKKLSCAIDKSSLKQSHRCCQIICELATLLYPNQPVTESCSCCNKDNEHVGIFLIERSKVENYLDAYNIIQLRYNKNTIVSIKAQIMNFGESKGETFDRVLIYPTKDMAKWLKDRNRDLCEETRAKFYVALTRARYSVGIVVNDNEEYHDYIKWNE